MQPIIRRDYIVNGNASLEGKQKVYRLGPLDYIPLESQTIDIALIFEPTNGVEPITAARITTAMGIALDTYPFLTGRLTTNDQVGERRIDSLGSGAQFIQAEMTATLSSYRSIGTDNRERYDNLLNERNVLLPPFPASHAAISRTPLLTIQHTSFQDHGVVLGVRLSHAICDGTGAFEFIQDLATACRRGGLNAAVGEGLWRPVVVPEVGRALQSMPADPKAPRFNFLNFYDEAERDAEDDMDEENDEDSEDDATAPTPPTLPDWLPGPTFQPANHRNFPNVKGRVLRINREKLKGLRGAATNTRASLPHDTPSYLDTLIAQICQSTFAARYQVCRQHGQQPSRISTDVIVPKDWRADLGFTTRYFLNAAVAGSTIIPQATLLHGSLGSIASAVHEMITGVKLRHIEQLIQWIHARPSKLKVRQLLHTSFGSLSVSSLQRMQVYNSFRRNASGQDIVPALVTPICSGIDGLCYVLPTTTQGAGRDLDITLELPQEVWAHLDNDTDWRDFIG